MRKHSSLHPASRLELLEARRLLSEVTLLGTAGDDHIVISFDPQTRYASVTGASNVADGTTFAPPSFGVRVSFCIDVGDGDDYVELGLEPAGPNGYSNVAEAIMLGGAGNDTLIGGNGHDTFDGGQGNDLLVGTNGNKSPFGDSEHNSLRFDSAIHGVRFNLARGIVYDDGLGGTDRVTGISSITGTPWDDIMRAGLESASLFGAGGNDLLVASKSPSAQYSVLYGGSDDDTLIGGSAPDQFGPGSGNDRVFGGGGGDTLEFGVTAHEYRDQDLVHGLLIRLDRGLVEDDGAGGRDIIKNIQNVHVDSPYNDSIYGDAQDNELTGNGGIDLIYGHDGDDTITVYRGILIGGHGNDHLGAHGSLALIKGGPGADKIELWGPKFSVERILLASGDTFTDHRYTPDPSQTPPPPVTLQLPPPEQRIAASPASMSSAAKTESPGSVRDWLSGLF